MIGPGSATKLIVIFAFIITVRNTCGIVPERTHFTAAVYDSVPVQFWNISVTASREEAVTFLKDDYFGIYAEQVANAKSQNADIIVFAEYGILPMRTTYNTLYPFLEVIPDPDTHPWNPCLDTAKHPNTEVQNTISCLARNYSIYIVANVGEKEYTNDSSYCRGTTRCQYNTNVVYDSEGNMIAKYRKANLFFENRYDIPTVVDFTYFDTPFGRFGTFICFDVLFKDPTILLIEEFEIDHIVFPTAWMNVMPYFSAVPFHQGFAIGTGVNFLSSNLHHPDGRYCGSGIYSPTTTLAYRNDYTSTDGALLVANLESKPTKVTTNPAVFDINISDQSTFESEVFGDIYNFVDITEQEGEFYVCHNHLCCYLDYRAKESTFEEHFAFGAFRGLHTKEGTYYIEVCLLFKCESQSRDSCGEWVFHSETIFERFNVTGNFSTNYVYPEVITDNVNPAAGEWTYDGRHVISNGVSSGLVSTSLFGRRYDLDDGSDDGIPWPSNAAPNTPVGGTSVILVFLLMARYLTFGF